MKKAGLFFGTFNPIHLGHLIIANHIAEYSDLSEVWMVVTPHNPHKKKASLLADHHRWQMVYRATENYPRIKPSNIEFSLPQPNYTVVTLAHLQENYPDYEFALIMGEDNLNHLHKWKNYEVILKNHHIYVYPRNSDSKTPSPFKELPNIHYVSAPVMEISSTFIRKSMAEKKNVRPLMPPEAWKYADEMNFYKK